LGLGVLTPLKICRRVRICFDPLKMSRSFIQNFAAPLHGLKLSWPKTKLQNVGAGDPSLTILIDHGSRAVLPMIDRLQLGWLTRGVDHHHRHF